MDSYELGMDQNQIYVKVDVGTAGVASTQVDIARLDGTSRKVAESSLQDGNISLTMIGLAEEIKNQLTIVNSMIDLGTIDPQNRPQAIKNIVITYTLSGGLSGTKDYHFSDGDVEISENGKIVAITKSINLV